MIANPSNLPPELSAFLEGADPDVVGARFVRPDGGIRWQALLSRGMDEDAAKKWRERTDRATRQRLEEIGGAWIRNVGSQGPVFTRDLWRLSVRLRLDLSMRPVIRDRGHADNDAAICCVRSAKGRQCTAALDDYAHHALTCEMHGPALRAS